jgi:type I restriction enzyme S subunit
MITQNNLPSIYPKLPLGELVTFLDNIRKPVKAEDRKPGPFPYYGANGLQGTIDSYLFDEPLVLLAEDGGNFGNPDRTIAYRVEGKCWVNNHAHVLRPLPCIDIGFLLHHLALYDVLPFTTGSTRAKLTKAEAEKIPLILPPIEEQRRIATILDLANSLTDKCRQAGEELSAFGQSLFLDMFGDPATNPRGWPRNSLSELFTAPPIFGTMIPPSIDGGEWLSLRVANIQDWKLDLTDEKYVALPASTVERHSVKDGDLLMARAIASQEHLGKAVVAHPNGHKWAFDSHLMRLRFDKTKVEPEVIRHLLMTPGGRSIFLQSSRRSAVQYNINTKEMSALRVPIPPIGIQKEFIKGIQSVERLADLRCSSLSKFKALFSSLHQRAFSGEL